MGKQIYQTNTQYLESVSTFFESLGFKPDYKILEQPPASGMGKLVQVTVKGFDPWKLDESKRNEWQNLPLEVIASK